MHRYIGLNIFCGMIWSPFTHLAAFVVLFPSSRVILSTFRNIIEKRYGMSEGGAANQASYLLAGSLVLYPIVSLMEHIVHSLSHVLILVWFSC